MNMVHGFLGVGGGFNKERPRKRDGKIKGKDKIPSSLHSLIRMHRFRREDETEPCISLYKGLIQTEWNMVECYIERIGYSLERNRWHICHI